VKVARCVLRGKGAVRLLTYPAAAEIPTALGSQSCSCTQPQGFLCCPRVNIRFYIDPETGLPHLYNHDVDEEEVGEVLESSGEDRPGRDGSRVALGQTRGGHFCALFTSVIHNQTVSL